MSYEWIRPGAKAEISYPPSDSAYDKYRKDNEGRVLKISGHPFHDEFMEGGSGVFTEEGVFACALLKPLDGD